MRYIRSVLLCLVMLSILQGCYIEPAWYGPPPLLDTTIITGKDSR